MNQGKIIEYIDQGRFVCTICLQDKGNRLHLLTPSNRQVNLSPKRVILISSSTINTLRPREELLERLNRTEETREKLKTQINVKDLWELIRDEKGSFNHEYLAKLVFGEAATDEHLSALVRALFEDHLHFKMKDGRFLPNSEEKVKQIITQKEEEALREEWLDRGSSWLKEVNHGKKPEDPANKEEIINLLIQLALHGTEATDYKHGKELLSRSGISDIREARNLLIRMGVWEKDENLNLLRLAIGTSFTDEQLDESDKLAQAEIKFEGREDLTHLSVLTIDGPLTRDYDDALSLEIAGDTLRLGVHIADVAETISPGSILDQEARDRASSLYLPRRQISMIPHSLSQDALSLKQGYNRPTISLLANFDQSGRLIDYRFVASVIRVRQKLTYEEVNEIIGSKTQPPVSSQPAPEGQVECFKEMYQISRHLRRKRMNQGALSLSLPELQFKFNDGSALSLELIDQNTPSRMIVAEFMILYNNLAARFCRDNQIPVLFRTQTEPNERLSEEKAGYLYYVFRQRRKLRPLLIDTVPNPHSGLGLDVYTQGTSPIRRYLDLVIQRQIKYFLMGTGPHCNEKELEEIRISAVPVIKNLEMIKRNRQRYWILKFLSRHCGEKYKACVLDELKSKYRIVLFDFLITAEIKRRNGMLLNPGEEILVEIKKADPANDLIDLAHVDE